MTMAMDARDKPTEIVIREISLALIVFLEEEAIKNSYYSPKYFPFIRSIILSHLKPYTKRGTNPLIAKENHAFFNHLHREHSVTELTPKKLGPKTKFSGEYNLYISRLNLPLHFRGGNIGEVYEPFIKKNDEKTIKITGNFPKNQYYLNDYFYIKIDYYLPSRIKKKDGWRTKLAYRRMKKRCLFMIEQFRKTHSPQLDVYFDKIGFEKTFQDKISIQYSNYQYYVDNFRTLFRKNPPQKIYLSHLLDPMNVAASTVAVEYGVERYGFQRGLSLGADPEVMGLQHVENCNYIPNKILALNSIEVRQLSPSNSKKISHQIYGGEIFNVPKIERKYSKKLKALLILQADNIDNKEMLDLLDSHSEYLDITIRQHPVYQFNTVTLSMFLKKRMKASFVFDDMQLPILDAIMDHDIVVTNFSTGLAISDIAKVPCLSLYLPEEYSQSYFCNSLNAQTLEMLISERLALQELAN